MEEQEIEILRRNITSLDSSIGNYKMSKDICINIYFNSKAKLTNTQIANVYDLQKQISNVGANHDQPSNRKIKMRFPTDQVMARKILSWIAASDLNLNN